MINHPNRGRHARARAAQINAATGRSLSLPKLDHGRDVMVQDDYDGLHAYIEDGEQTRRFSVAAPPERIEAMLYAIRNPDDMEARSAFLGSLRLTPAKIAAAAHVQERDRPRELRRIRKALRRRFRGGDFDAKVDWSGPTPHTAYNLANEITALVSVFCGGNWVAGFRWDGHTLITHDAMSASRSCNCAECRAALAERSVR